MSATNPPQSVINTTVGPLVTGVMIGQLLLGIICIQVTGYFRQWTNDSLYIKSLVGVLAFLNVLLGVIDYQVLYRATVLHYGDYAGFDLEQWTMWSEPAFTAIVGFLCQVFFLVRSWKATRSKVLVSILATMVLFSLGSGLAVSISFFKVERFSALALIPLPICFWLISTSVVDVSIATVLIVVLLRSKTKYSKTKALVSQMVQLSMETSAATAIVATLNLILYFVYIKTAYHLLPQFSMSRVYTITVLVTLASREKLRSIMDSRTHATCVTDGQNPSVHINVSTTVDRDEGKATGNWVTPNNQSDIELAQSPRIWEQKAGGPL